MGSGSFTAAAWDSYTTSRGYTSTSSTASMYTSHGMKSKFDPKNIKIRESRDSAEHPNSTPIIIGLDVTGSMSSVLGVVSKRLGDTMGEIYSRQPVTDPQVCFMAFGDAEWDSSPLQVTQFESDIRIAEQLNDIYFERGGGGNDGESYMLPWYFAATHVDTDAAKKGKKGFLFTIGDEPCLPRLTKEQIKDFIGDDVERDFTSEELLTQVSRNYEVYHLCVGNYRYYHSPERWEKLLGNNVIVVQDVEKIPEIIVSILELNAGKSVNEVVNSWDGTAALVVKNALGGLMVTMANSASSLVEF